MLDQLTKFAEHALGRVQVRSALNPILWLCGLTLLACVPAAIFTDGHLQISLIILAFIPVLVACVAYIYLMIKSPDKLRSEEYELRRIALGMIEEKGGSIPMSESSLEAIANSDYKQSAKEIDGERL